MYKHYYYKGIISNLEAFLNELTSSYFNVLITGMFGGNIFTVSITNIY